MYTRAEFGMHGVIAAFVYLLTLPLSILRKLIYQNGCSETNKAQDMKGKVVVVTGSNCGVGFETARNLALRGAEVVLACRDKRKGEAALAVIYREIQKATLCTGKAVFIQLDLENFQSILHFAESFRKQFARLDILVNNGGINTSGITSYGLQKTFCTNYLGHFYLFCLLQPLLATTDENDSTSCSRVVNLSSVMHHVGSSDFKTSAYFGTRSTDNMANNNTYSDSKLYMNFLTMEINRRYCMVSESSGRRPITAISVNPGAVRSNIWRAIPWPISAIYDLLVMRVFYLSTEQGAASSIFACSVPSNDLFRDSDLVITEDGTVSPKSKATVQWGKFCGHIFLPYVVPYRCCLCPCRGSATTTRAPAGLAAGSGWFLFFECLGAFDGAQWSRATIPESGDVSASALWKFSREVVVEKSGNKDAFSPIRA